MNWREKMYKSYRDHYVVPARGKQTLADIQSQFRVWQKYYGSSLPKNKDALILDIGCGNGEIVYWLREMGFKNATGVEADLKQFEEAKNLGIPGIALSDFREFVKGKSAYYDCIIARDVIEHFDKDELLDILEIIYQSIKPAGTLIIQTPNAESPFGSRHRYYDFTHSLSFTWTSLGHVLKTIGFEKIFFYPARPVVHGLKSLIRFCLWQLIELLLRFYLLVETGSAKAVLTQNIIAVAKK